MQIKRGVAGTALCIVLMVCLTASLCIPVLNAQESKKSPIQYIGIVPLYTPEKIWQLYQPFIEYLNKNTRIPWGLKLYESHASIVNGLCNGDIAIAFLGPMPLLHAYDKCQAKPLLMALDDEGNPALRSVIATNDPAVQSLSGLKGKKFGLYKNSTIAYVLPKKMLSDEGISLDMVDPVYFTSLDRIMHALLSNDIAAGGVTESMYLRFKEFNLRALKTSDPMPPFTFCSLPGYPSQKAKQFTKALLKIDPRSNKSHRKLLEKWDPELSNGFAIPSADYLNELLGSQRMLMQYGQ